MTATTTPTYPARTRTDDLEPTPIEGLRVGDLVRRTAENYAGAPVGVVIAVHDATELSPMSATVRYGDTDWSGTGRAWTVVGMAPEDTTTDTGRLVAAARLQAQVRQAEATLARLTGQRDDVIRAALEAGDSVATLATGVGMTRSRVYQVRDRRR